MSCKTVKLGDVCTKIGSGSTPRGGAAVYTTSGTAFIRSQNVYNLRFDYDGLAHINDDSAKKLNGVTIEEQDVLLNITGDSVARTCLVPTDILPARVSQHVAIIRPKRQILDPSYLCYYLASPYMQSFMLGLAVGKGASRNAMTKGMISNYEIPCPKIETQRAIVKILNNYDDLIKNNQKQIELLEEVAHRLYKEWFIDLRFPRHEDVEIVDGVPEGWRITEIKDVCVKINAGGTPKRNNATYWNIPTYKWFKTGELQDCWLLESEEYISEEGLNNSSAKLFPATTLVMAIYASPTLGRIGILASEATCNQAALCMIADKQYTSWQWLYHKLYELRDEFNAVAKGAGQQNISAEVVKHTTITLPTLDLVEMFTQSTDAIFAKRLSLQSQICVLQEARDRLLPKLMCGEIEV